MVYLAVNQAIPKEPAGEESPQTLSVRAVLQVLVKAQKALRLYHASNAISVRLQEECFSGMSAHLDQYGAFTLTIREFRILMGEDRVYESDDRNDSLAFVLFRDGIRKLTFNPGIEQRELQGFLACLNRVSVLSNEQDDLVTLFWEEDFRAIQYYAVDELATNVVGPRLQDQLASGSLEPGEGGGAPADVVNLKDIEQPAAFLPVDACRLSEQEIEALRAELARDESALFATAVVELAIELTLQESPEEEQKSLAENLTSIVNRLLSEGKLEEVSRAFEHLKGLTEMSFRDSQPVCALNAKLSQFLSAPEQVERFLEQAEGHRSLKPAALTAYLARLDPGAVTALVPWMGRMTTPARRRAVAEAVLAAGDPGQSELERHLLTGEQVLDEAFLREISYVLVHTPASRALPMVEKLLRAPDVQVRRQMVAVLGRLKDPQTDELCLSVLADSDPEIRSSALDTLVRRGNPELAKSILDRATHAPEFYDRSLAEKRRVFAAVAKLGGVAALDLLVPLLRLDERRWFASKTEREGFAAVIHGIRLVGTEESRELLREIADKGNRAVRAAALKALEKKA